MSLDCKQCTYGGDQLKLLELSNRSHLPAWRLCSASVAIACTACEVKISRWCNPQLAALDGRLRWICGVAMANTGPLRVVLQFGSPNAPTFKYVAQRVAWLLAQSVDYT